VTVVDESWNYQYRCEFALFQRVDTIGGEDKKLAVFNRAISNFSYYFPFSGCGDTLTLGQTCNLKLKIPLIPILLDFLKVYSPVKVVDIGTNYFILNSLKGHPEGEDRFIKFAVYIIDNELRLGVLAWGPPSFAAKATVRLGGATLIWRSYANKLKTIK
jgi:hypothetical protein